MQPNNLSVKPFSITLSPQDLQVYADASGDRNAIHLDAAFARAAGLPGVVAQGMLNMGIMASALDPFVQAGFQLDQWSARFKRFVEPGSPLAISGEVTGQSAQGLSVALQLAGADGEIAVSVKAKLIAMKPTA